jgi:hypothetical protein
MSTWRPQGENKAVADLPACSLLPMKMPGCLTVLLDEQTERCSIGSTASGIDEADIAREGLADHRQPTR